MFSALQTLLATLASLSVSMVANDDGTLTVTVIPKGKKDGESALNTPLTLTGTAAELDAEFANCLTGFTAKHLSLAEQLQATEAILEAAKKESATKATKSIKKGASTVPAGKSESEEEEEEDENKDVVTSTATASSSAAAPAGAPAPKSDDNLWG